MFWGRSAISRAGREGEDSSAQADKGDLTVAACRSSNSTETNRLQTEPVTPKSGSRHKRKIYAKRQPACCRPGMFASAGQGNLTNCLAAGQLKRYDMDLTVLSHHRRSDASSHNYGTAHQNGPGKRRSQENPHSRLRT
jgi:hypothetical protein